MAEQNRDLFLSKVYAGSWNCHGIDTFLHFWLLHLNPMKKKITHLIVGLILFVTPVISQPLTGSFTDCNNRTEDIQATLGTGKAVIIAHKGVDCSICISQAPSLQTWASQNTQKVAVWAAMTWKYNPNTFAQPCPITQTWITTHSWNDIFTFPDYNRAFINNATPRYYVYSPRDSTIKYSGSNRSTAYSVALQESTVGIQSQQIRSKVKWTIYPTQIQLENTTNEELVIRIFSLNGSIVKEMTMGARNLSIDMSNESQSIYLLQIQSSTDAFTEKVFIR